MMDLRSSAKIYLSAIFALIITLFILDIFNVFLLAKLVIGLIIYSVTYLIMIKLTKTLNKSDYPVFRALVGEKGSIAGILNKLLDIFESD
jgi:hypothetical protein